MIRHQDTNTPLEYMTVKKQQQTEKSRVTFSQNNDHCYCYKTDTSSGKFNSMENVITIIMLLHKN